MKKKTIHAPATSGVSVTGYATEPVDTTASAIAHLLQPTSTNCASGQSEQMISGTSGKPVGAPLNIPYRAHPDLMPPPAAAAYLGVKESTLAIWRCTRRYKLPYIKVGRLVQYRKSDLDAFLLSRIVEGT